MYIIKTINISTNKTINISTNKTQSCKELVQYATSINRVNYNLYKNICNKYFNHTKIFFYSINNILYLYKNNNLIKRLLKKIFTIFINPKKNKLNTCTLLCDLRKLFVLLKSKLLVLKIKKYKLYLFTLFKLYYYKNSNKARKVSTKENLIALNNIYQKTKKILNIKKSRMALISQEYEKRGKKLKLNTVVKRSRRALIVNNRLLKKNNKMSQKNNQLIKSINHKINNNNISLHFLKKNKNSAAKYFSRLKNSKVLKKIYINFIQAKPLRNKIKSKRVSLVLSKTEQRQIHPIFNKLLKNYTVTKELLSNVYFNKLLISYAQYIIIKKNNKKLKCNLFLIYYKLYM